MATRRVPGATPAPKPEHQPIEARPEVPPLDKAAAEHYLDELWAKMGWGPRTKAVSVEPLRPLVPRERDALETKKREAIDAFMNDVKAKGAGPCP